MQWTTEGVVKENEAAESQNPWLKAKHCCRPLCGVSFPKTPVHVRYKVKERMSRTHGARRVLQRVQVWVAGVGRGPFHDMSLSVCVIYNLKKEKNR